MHSLPKFNSFRAALLEDRERSHIAGCSLGSFYTFMASTFRKERISHWFYMEGLVTGNAS
jgi:hypothetical protein